MACSGIAEHNEARRKGRREELRAFLKKQLLEKLEDGVDAPEQSTYEREFTQKRGSPGLISASPHNAAFVDQQRRELIRQQKMVEYTAKLPKRFSSTDYSSQW